MQKQYHQTSMKPYQGQREKVTSVFEKKLGDVQFNKENVSKYKTQSFYLTIQFRLSFSSSYKHITSNVQSLNVI